VRETVIALIAATLCFAPPALLAIFFPSICWAPRIGGTLVGLVVVVQGHIYMNPEKYSRKLSDGISLQDRIMQIAFVVAVLGTFMWAWSDLFPNILGIENLACTP
jgi:hypothetical protein